MTKRRRQAFYLPAVILLLAATWLIYANGLHGGFLFDDFANLPALGASGPVDNSPAFWRYITSGTADPLGRPLAMLSFLFDAHDWPADPLPFKRSNLFIHLFNGILLSLLLRLLGRSMAKTQKSDIGALAIRVDLAAVLGAGFWLMHPLLVSTTLYIVQREAMLSSTFILLGLLAWMRGRHAMHRGHTVNGLCWLTLGLVGCTVLSLLSKANGILLPVLAIVIDGTVMATSNSPAVPGIHKRIYRSAMLLLGWLPLTLVAGYLLYQGWYGLTHGISSVRPWTAGQRLLTEPRVLMDYLHLLWLPHPFTPGLFNDQIHASTSLWSPAATLPSLLAVTGLILGAWVCRRRYPAWALAILFFFAGQSLESSSVPLELYFEHRNYLPAMLMFWPLALWLCGLGLTPTSYKAESYPLLQATPYYRKWTESRKPIAIWRIAKPLLASALLLGLGLMTYALASLWGNAREQTQLWAALNPESPRAQADAAEAEINTGHPALAVARLQRALVRAPDQAQLAMNLFDAQCQLGQVEPAFLITFGEALRTTRDTGPLLVNWFTREMDQVGRAACSELTFKTLGMFLDAAAANRKLNEVYGRRQDISYLRGHLALIQGDPDTALLDFNRALDEDPQISMALEQAALLGSSGFPRQGLAHLDHYERVRRQAVVPGFGMSRLHAWVLQRQHYWPGELARLRDTLTKDTVPQVNAVHESCESNKKNCSN
ncbi:tetratricopeptide repeat protein [Rhodanobacter sp. K2T2]|uniref:tetratricopeptide repeat protein n=1 Tax=Rhodanobacter sp. K2T2 TaxID=2723085 RepID=UPI001C54AA48